MTRLQPVCRGQQLSLVISGRFPWDLDADGDRGSAIPYPDLPPAGGCRARAARIRLRARNCHSLCTQTHGEGRRRRQCGLSPPAPSKLDQLIATSIPPSGRGVFIAKPRAGGAITRACRTAADASALPERAQDLILQRLGEIRHDTAIIGKTISSVPSRSLARRAWRAHISSRSYVTIARLTRVMVSSSRSTTSPLRTRAPSRTSNSPTIPPVRCCTFLTFESTTMDPGANARQFGGCRPTADSHGQRQRDDQAAMTWWRIEETSS
jgi:hypothetical protein